MKNKDQTTSTAERLQPTSQIPDVLRNFFTTKGTYSFPNAVNVNHILFLDHGDSHNTLSLTFGSYSTIPPHIPKTAILCKYEGFQTTLSILSFYIYTKNDTHFIFTGKTTTNK